MTRPRGDVRKAEPVHELGDAAPMIIDAPARQHQRLQVEAAPARQMVQSRRRRPGFDQRGQLGLLTRRQPPRGARRGPVGEAVRTFGVEPVNPVPERLPVHPRQPRRIRTAPPLVNRRDRQQPANHGAVQSSRRQPPNRHRIIIQTQTNRRHRQAPLNKKLESHHRAFGNPPRVSLSGLWY